MFSFWFKNKRHRLWALAGLVLVLYVSMVRVSETDTVCGSCHGDLKERWAQSTHQENHCRDCHVEPGVKGQLKAQRDGLHNLWVSVTKGNEIPPHADPVPIKAAQCLDCHAGVLRVNEVGQADLPSNALWDQGLRMAHRVHIEKHGMSCVECHRGVTHRDPEDEGKYRINRPLMNQDCGVCHNGRYWERFKTPVSDLNDPARCIVCHPRIKP